MNALCNFSDIIAPIEANRFIAEYWNPKKYLLIRGQREKFEQVLPWRVINEMILGREHDASGRFRLVKDGNDIPLSSVTIPEARRFRTKRLPRLKRALLSDCLKSGAVLILNRVDDIHEPVRRLSEMIEYALHEQVYINMYAGWQSSKGFNLHWDDHDVLVLQVHGEKHWTINGFSKSCPLYKSAETIPPPKGEPLWKGVIRAGDVLYIPRGCWHGAEALDGPTVHLTCGLYNQTGHDLLAWLQSKLATHEAFCRDLPRFCGKKAQQQHLQELKQAFETFWDEQALQTFFEEKDMLAQSHERLLLPFGVSPIMDVRLTEETEILMQNPRPLQIVSDPSSDEISFCASGRQWRFHVRAKAILSFLDEKRVCSFAELTEAMQSGFDERALKAFIRELFHEGLVCVQ